VIRDDPLLSAQVFLTALKSEAKRGSLRREVLTALQNDHGLLQHVLLGAQGSTTGKGGGIAYAATLDECGDPPNQDGVGFFPEYGLFVIVDGYQEEGHWLSLLLLATIHESPKASASAWIKECVSRARELAVGPFSGTCIVSLQLKGKTASAHWLGDSKCFHIRGNQILFHTREHTVAEDAIADGKASPASLWNAREHHVVSHSVHALTDDVPSAQSLQLQTGDWIVLCSDGISDNVKTLERGAESYRRVAGCIAQARTAEEARDLLLTETKRHIAANVRDDRTLANSKPDNLSLIVIRIDSGS